MPTLKTMITDWLRVKTQGSTPATPASGYGIFYDKNKTPAFKNSDGTEYILLPASILASTDWAAKGDMVLGTANDTAAILSVGSNGQYLIADSSQATGHKYVTGGRELISRATPSGTGTVTFSSIPSTYNTLEVVATVRGTQTAVYTVLSCYLNNDLTAGNYRSTRFNAYGTNSSSIDAGDAADVGLVAADSAPANSCAQLVFQIANYAGTTFNKQISGRCTTRADATGTVRELNSLIAVEWESAVAVNRLDLSLASGNFVAGSVISLYGLY